MNGEGLQSVKKQISDDMPKLIPYGRQWIDEEDIDAVVEVLRSNWLTTGPKVEEFEKEFASFTGASEAVAVSNGTAALHAIMYVIGIRPGDEVIVSPLTFVATANAVIFQGGRPVFADVDPETLLIDPEEVKKRITSRTKAVIAVDYAGQPCDYAALRAITDRFGIKLIADACHALGASCKEKPVGTLADLTAFSFHPVKHITTGEGGMVTTNRKSWADKMRRFRNHGIDSDHRRREQSGTWYYEMVDLGYNYRITDLQCALGLSQLRKLPDWLKRRQEIAETYNKAFADLPWLTPLTTRQDVSHAYHLYVVQLHPELKPLNRASIFKALRKAGIITNVHYIPVHLHPFYRENLGTGTGQCPQAELAYERILSLPMYPALTKVDQNFVISSLKGLVK